MGTANDNISTVEANQFAPIDLLDYIYAVLHCPSYREKYKEVFKDRFPKGSISVCDLSPQQVFFKLVDLGSQLREIHLLESPVVEKYITKYPIDGDNVVTKPRLDLTGFENLSGLGNV